MRTPKKPPPDTVGNVRGRIALLQLQARRSASFDVRDGGDLDRALAGRLREIAPQLAELKRRLEKVQRGDKVDDARPEKPEPSRRKRPRIRTPGDDLLDQLDSL